MNKATTANIEWSAFRLCVGDTMLRGREAG